MFAHSEKKSLFWRKVIHTNYCTWKAICIWVKVFKNGPSKICGRQPFKNLK